MLAYFLHSGLERSVLVKGWTRGIRDGIREGIRRFGANRSAMGFNLVSEMFPFGIQSSNGKQRY